jgi:GxxExxY protein
MALLFEDLTEKILASCFEVSHELGTGLLESVYQNALMIALRDKGIRAKCEFPLSVRFRGQVEGKSWVIIMPILSLRKRSF